LCSLVDTIKKPGLIALFFIKNFILQRVKNMVLMRSINALTHNKFMRSQALMLRAIIRFFGAYFQKLVI